MKALPHNLEAEQALIGCAMFDNEAVRLVEGIVRPIQFYEPFHQRLWGAIWVLVQRERLADPLTLIDQFKNDRTFDDLGGRTYFADLVDRAPPASCAPDYARVIADLDGRRQLIRAADALKAEALDMSVTVDASITGTEARLIEVLRGQGIDDNWIDGNELAKQNADILSGEGKPVYVPTGLSQYDHVVGGFQAQRFNIMAARPKMGKSAVAVCIALEQAKAGLGVGMFSLEMDRGELSMRAACAMAYEPGADDNPMYFLAAKNELSPEARRKMAMGGNALRDLPIRIDDRAGLRPSDIVPAAKRLLRQWERKGITPGCIFVDHLTIVRPDFQNGNKVQEVSEVSGALRDLARTAGVTVVGLCQLSREVDKRGVADKRPQKSDLRWSGELEQDAAQITFLYRPEAYLREPNKTDENYLDRITEYEIQKSRWGNRVLLLNEANRLGPTGVEIEYGISLGCNAMWELDE